MTPAKTVLISVHLIIVFTTTLACGPGPGGIRRRGARKLTPLVYKQHEPNFSERSLAASGLPEGLVDRSSDRFRHLVPNYNPDIMFKDEELTGADRLMTQRCKEKLNTLAISVMNQWPGIRLRVTEAWDEDFHHAEQSLHYEGRAVDITTSDRDRTKYGLLARLAVESGFDWVYYESRAHIHASCKSESAHPSKSGGCFKGDSMVMLDTGNRKQMSDLEIGDVVLSVDADGNLQFSPVILFLDRDAKTRRQYYVVETESGVMLTVTPSHLIYADVSASDVNDVSSNDVENFVAVFASRVREGDYILVQQNGEMRPSRVVNIDTKVYVGAFAPLTSSGNIVVDGALASCYAVLENQFVSHAAFAPFRWSHKIKSWLDFSSRDVSNEDERNVRRSNSLKSESTDNKQRTTGIHWYADILYSLAQVLMPERLR